MEKEVIRHYTNGELTVVWKPAACIHSRNCWNAVTGMPAVFDPRKRPWVTMENGQTAAIEAQVAKCPSGALSTFYNSTAEAAPTSSTPQTSGSVAVASPAATSESSQTTGSVAAIMPEAPLRIRVLANGPLLVNGSCEVEDASGNIQLRNETTALCRCGFSAIKPYCDGSHVREGFQG